MNPPRLPARRGHRRAARQAAIILFMALGWPAALAAPTSDGIIFYGTSTSTPQLRTYSPGTPGTFGAQTGTVSGDVPTFVVDRSATTRDEHLAGYVTTAGYLYVYRWDGASWIDETSAGNGWGAPVFVGGNGVDGRRFDIAYESVNGDALVVYSNNTSGASELRYRVWNGTGWTPATSLDSARLQNVPTWIKLLPRPGSDEVALTVCDNGNATNANTAVLTTFIWSGTAWGNEPGSAHSTSIYSTGNTTPNRSVTDDLFDQAWESTTGNLMVVFTQSNNAGQYYRRFSGSPTRSWGTSALINSGATARVPPLQMFAASDPNSAYILAGWNRSGSGNVYAYQWSGSSWSASTTVGTTGVTTDVNQRTVTGKWMVLGATSYAVVLWGTTTDGRVDYNYATAGGTFLTTPASRSFTSPTPGAWAWMDSAVDPLSKDTLELTFADVNRSLWARQLVLTAGPTFTWTTDTSAALTTALTNATSQGFAFAYTQPKVTLGNGGAEPANSSIALGQVGAIDAFSLQANAGTATVTAVNVSLTFSAGSPLSNIFVNSAATCDGTTYGTLNSPTSGNNTITLSTNVSADSLSGGTDLYLCGTAASVGSTATVSGTVASVTAASYASIDNDTTSATVTVTVPPSITIGNGSAEPGSSTITLDQYDAFDAFSVQTGSGTATITAVRVNLTFTGSPLANVFVNSNSTCTGTTYGTLASPVSGNNTITLATSITATTTSSGTNLYVCGTAASVGTNTNVTGNVSSVTAAGYTSTDSDNGNSTLTVAPPPSVTIGNGSSEPGSSTITLDQFDAFDTFTVQTSSGSATITAVRVNLNFTGSPLANVFINSNSTCTGTTYGTLASPVSGSNTINLSTNITATTSSGGTNLYVCGTAADVGFNINVTGNVSAVTASGYTSNDNDNGNSTLTIAVPPDLTIGNGFTEPGNSTITLGQFDGFDTFSLQTSSGTATITAVTVSLSFTGSPLSNVFINDNAACTGTTYGTLVGPVSGSNTITLSTNITATTTTITRYVCGTAAGVATNTNVTGNVSSVAATGYTSTDNDTGNSTLTVAPPSVTIGNGGAEPGNSTIAFGQYDAVDTFTLQTNAGTATITAVTVSLNFTGSPLLDVFINSNATCTGTTYGTLASPVSGSNIITLSTNVTATGTSSTLYVCGTADIVASNTNVTGNVSSVTASGYTSIDNDTGSSTLTVAPPRITIGNGSAEPGNRSISLDQVGAIDTFSLETDTGVATVTAVTVNLTLTGSPLANVFINSMSTCTGTTYGTVASPVWGSNTINLATSLGATTTSASTDIYLCGTAANVGGNTTVTGTVSSVTATGYSSTDNDTGSSTLTIIPPPNVSIGNGSAEPGSSTIRWTQVGPIDTFSVQTSSGTATITAVRVNLNFTGSPLTNVFINSNATCTGTTYGTLASPVLGNNTITLSTSITATTTSSSTNVYVCGTAASVGFNTNVTGNVSAVWASGYTWTDNDTGNSTLTVAPPPNVTIGNGGAEPGNSTISLGQFGGIDTFTLQTSSGTATVTAVEVSLSFTGSPLADVFVNSNATCTGTTYGTLAGPVSGSNSITLTTNISATTTSSTLYVCGTAAGVVTNTTVTGNVSSVTASGYTFTDNDSGSSTLTVTPPVVTIGNGSAEPGNSTITWTQAGAIDTFSVQTSAGTATVSAVTVGLTFSAGSPLLDVFVNSTAACTGTTYGTLASPVSGSNTITLSTAITATTTSGSTNLYVCGTAANVGASATVTGNLSAVTASGFISSDSDTGSSTLTVAVPPRVTIGNGSAEPGNSTITLGQVGGIDTLSMQTTAGTATITAISVNLTFTGSPLTNIFINGSSTCTGTTYGTLASPVSGANTVTLSTHITATTTSGATNYYLCGTAAVVASNTNVTGNAFAVTAVGYNSTDNDTGNSTLTVAVPPNVSIGNGSAEPGNSTASFGQVGGIDAFSVQTSSGTATITAVAVALSFTGSPLSNVFINSNSACTGTTYGTLASPVSGANTVTLSTHITATTTSSTTNLYLCGTAAAVVSDIAVTGSVSSVTAVGYTSSDGDTTNATLTVTPPRITIGDGSAEPADSSIPLGQVGAIDAFSLQTSVGTATVTAVAVSLTLSSGTPLSNVFINSSSACNGTTYGARTNPTSGSNTITLSTGITATPTSGGTDFFVCGTAGAVAANATVSGNVSSVTATAYVPTDSDTTNATLTVLPVPITSTGSIMARVNSCTMVTASATYTGDTDVNNTVSFSRSTDGTSFVDLAACQNLGGGNPRSCVDSTVSANTTYWYRALFADPGGVAGTNPLTTSATVNTGACPPNLRLSNPSGQPTAGTLTIGAASWTHVVSLALATNSSTLNLSSIGVVNSGASPQATASDLQLNLLDAAGSKIYSTAAWDGSKWVFGSISDPTTGLPLTISTTATTFRVYARASNGAAASENLTAQFIASNMVAVAPFFPTTGATFSGNNFVTAAPALVDEGSTTANTGAPVVSIVNPDRGKVLTGTFLVQVYVFSPNAAAITAKALTTDGSTPTCAADDALLAKETSRAYSQAGAAMYSKTLALSPGAYTLKACARNASGSIVSQSVAVTVRAAGTGDGSLIVRDNSAQLCADCHDQNKIKTHSSETTSNAKGSWAATCRDCHTPHGTRNLYLVREQIVPPAVNGYQPAKDVRFATMTGDSQVAGLTSPTNSSFANADNTGPCQVCHTRTANPVGGAARWRNTGNADSHYAGASTKACTNCHSHRAGFKASESSGGTDCSGCHSTIWDGMTGAVAKTSKHTLGGVFGTNDSFADTSVAWGSPLSNNAASVRSCVNMCHQDHVHTPPDGGTLHDFNVHNDATSNSSRAVTRNGVGAITGGTPNQTDFDSTATNGGLCVSCHQSPVESGASPAHPAVAKASYGTSAHNYRNDTTGVTASWTYTLHDGTTFERNCTKCHFDSLAYGNSTAGAGAVHFSANASLLAENPSRSSGGSDTNFLCYGCHSGAASRNSSDKNIQAALAKVYRHPVATTDHLHQSYGAAGETAGTGSGFQSGAFSGANRHVACPDCHDVHQAGRTSHTRGSAALLTSASPLWGVWGVQGPPKANWADYAVAGDFVRMSAVTAEYQICFKCHSKWAAATLPNSPSGAFPGTNTAQEFNVNNTSYHWVEYDQTATVAPASGAFGPAGRANNTPRALDMASNTTWQTGWNSNSKMTCSDCHEGDAVADPRGPHGSANAYLLRSIVIGTNTYKRWDATVTYSSATGTNAVFCLGCHNIGGTSGFCCDSGSTNLHTSKHNGRPCQTCHVAIPHGWQRYRFLYLSTDPTPYRALTNGFTGTPTWKMSGQWTESDCHSGSIVGGCG